MKKLNLRVIIIIFFLFGLCSIFATQVKALTSLDSYCKDYHYQTPIEDASCHRASDACGISYEDTKNIPYDHNRCLGNGTDDRATKVCAGYVPLCCYEVERTGIPTKCGWPEIMYCHPQQCNRIPEDLRSACSANRDQNCHCGYSISSWCLSTDNHPSIPYIPLETRLGLQTQPTKTPTPTIRIMPTNLPTPTNTPLIPTNPRVSTNPQTPTKANTPTPQDVPFYPQTRPIDTNDQTTSRNTGFSFAFFSIPKIFPNLITGENKLKVKIVVANSAKTFNLFGYIFSSIVNIDNTLEKTINNAIGIGE